MSHVPYLFDVPMNILLRFFVKYFNLFIEVASVISS